MAEEYEEYETPARADLSAVVESQREIETVLEEMTELAVLGGGGWIELPSLGFVNVEGARTITFSPGNDIRPLACWISWSLAIGDVSEYEAADAEAILAAMRERTASS